MFVSPLNNIDELIVAPEGIRGKNELPIYIYIYIYIYISPMTIKEINVFELVGEIKRDIYSYLYCF
jgi:hypothetical protein